MEFWDYFWLIVASFFFIAFLMMLFAVFADIFRDRETSGWAKAGWSVLVLVFPLLGSLIYLIARGNTMARRQTEQARAGVSFPGDDGRATAMAGTGQLSSPAAQVAQAKALLDSGAISAQEYADLKAKALA